MKKGLNQSHDYILVEGLYRLKLNKLIYSTIEKNRLVKPVCLGRPSLAFLLS